MLYHQLSAILTVAPLASLAMPLAHPWDDMRVKHAWNAVPADWESLGYPPPDTTIDLYVALKPQNENLLIDTLYEVSTPRHPKYGAHLSREEVAKLVAPHPDTLELVHSWLAHQGVQSSSISTTHGGNWLTLTGVPVSQANELLGASYQLYRHARRNDTALLRTVGYALPAVLHAHVKTVSPTTFFASEYTLEQTPGALGTSGSRELLTILPSRDEPELVTPQFLRWMYNTFYYVPAATDQNALGIMGYKYDYPSSTDLTLFMTTYRTDAEAATYTVKLVNDGGYDPSHPGTEANLDMQYAQAIAYPTPHVYYSTGGRLRWYKNGVPSQDDVFLASLVYMLSLPNADIPQTISLSYGVKEMRFPREYAETICTLFGEFGARGVSILVSSGDNGVGDGDCKVRFTDGSEKVRFIPRFPASCPWVTSVGGTTSSHPEVAASLSGGGFSNYFPRPKYQSDDVPVFLMRLGEMYQGSYDPNGRGIPDISAQALRFITTTNNKPLRMRGTSCAAPTVAGIISLLNDYLISNGKRPLGFLNPWLYGDGIDGLNDIIYGSNPGCGTDGFPAIAGWDPVTGLGTPDFFKLQGILFRKVVGLGDQGPTFSELLNNSDKPVPLDFLSR